MKIKKRYHLRICYKLDKNGKMDRSKEIYEVYKYCKCDSCRRLTKERRLAGNRITITTKDINKINEMYDFLDNWECGSNKQNDYMYMEFK